MMSLSIDALMLSLSAPAVTDCFLSGPINGSYLCSNHSHPCHHYNTLINNDGQKTVINNNTAHIQYIYDATASPALKSGLLE